MDCECGQEGGYGAYLLDKQHWPLVGSIVSAIKAAVAPMPVLCKIRLLDRFDDTVKFCQLLEAAGWDMIAVHGRKRGSVKRRRYRWCG